VDGHFDLVAKCIPLKFAYELLHLFLHVDLSDDSFQRLGILQVPVVYLVLVIGFVEGALHRGSFQRILSLVALEGCSFFDDLHVPLVIPDSLLEDAFPLFDLHTPC